MTDTLILTTGSGKFDLLNPRVEDVNIDDMLRNLSRIVRFTGASPFTVLQHSLYVGRLLRAQGESGDVILAGFVHDLHEYITGDIAAPILANLHYVFKYGDEDDVEDSIRFTKLQARAQVVINERLGCPHVYRDYMHFMQVRGIIDGADMASRRFEVNFDYLNVPEIARDIVNMTPFACIEAFKAELAALGVTI